MRKLFHSPKKKTSTSTKLESIPPFPAETKKYNNIKCSLCQELLSLTLPGELIVLLECGHMSHKNCLSLIQSVPVCSECNVMSNYDYPPFTPVDQIQSPAKLNTQLETPSFTSSDQTIYNPRVTCTSEIFDILEVSVTGKSWDLALVCLFENYFLIYENELLVGIISVQHDISSVDVDEELILNLAKDSLPELRLRHSNKLVVQKWGTLLLEIIDNESVVTNIYQLTNTYWTHLPPEICVPQNLTKLNNAILSGTTISNSDIARILPTPKQLLLNLILALPLVNQTSLTDLEYKTQLQQIFQKTLHELRPNDKLGIIFLGIDGSKKPCAKGSFVGCTEPSWGEWKQVIRDITIVPNSFQSNLQEINVAIEKCRK